MDRDDITANIDPRFNGLRIRAGEDFFINEFSPLALNNVYYQLTASKEDEYLITESPSLEDVDQFYNPGIDVVCASFILEAITVDRYAQTDKRMAAMVRVLNRFLKGNDKGIEAQQAIVGKPKKSGTFAYVTVQIPFSDGQTISMVFHSPEGGKVKIGPGDSLIAFRWLMNKRDITHVVAPEAGKDVSLMSVGKRITQLLIKNHDRFVKVQKAAAEEQQRLEALTTETEALEESNTVKAEKLVTIDADTESIDTKIADTQTKIGDQQTKNADLEAQISLLRAQEKAKSVVTGPTPNYLTPDNAHTSSVYLEKGEAPLTVVNIKQKTITVLVNTKNFTFKFDGTGFKRSGQYLYVTPASKREETLPEPSDPGGDAKLDQKVMSVLTNELKRFVATMRKFETGEMAGYDISLFRSSFVGKLRTKIKNGYQAEVAETLEELKRLQAKILDKPPLAARNGIWKDAGVDPKAVKPKEVAEKPEPKIAKKDPFWNPAKLPGEIRAALKKVQVRPVVGEISTKAPFDIRKGGHLIMNAARPLLGDSEKMWSGEFNKGRFYVGIDPNGEFSKQNIEGNRKLDAWLLAYVNESEVEAWGQKEYGARLEKLGADEKTTFVRERFFSTFDGMTYPEFIDKWNAKGKAEAAPSDVMTPMEELPEGWGAVKTTLGITYTKVVDDETVGIEVTPMEDGSFSIEKVSKAGEVREDQTNANDERNANRIALEMINQVDSGAKPPEEDEFARMVRLSKASEALTDDERKALRNQKIGSDEGMKEPLVVTFVIQNKSDTFYLGLDEEKSIQKKYSYIKKGLGTKSMKIGTGAFNQSVDLNRAIKAGIEFRYFKLEPRKGYALASFTIDLREEAKSPFDSVDGAPIGKGPFSDFIAQYQSALGVETDTVNIKNKDGGLIGYVEKNNMDVFISGDASALTPVDDWRTTFSIDLQNRLGLREDAKPEKLIDAGIDPISPEGYAQVMANEELQIKYQGQLDSFFAGRIGEIRNELRALGWDGDAYKNLGKNGYTLKPIIKSVGAGNNVVGVNYEIEGVTGFFMSDTLELSAKEMAEKIDLGLPKEIEALIVTPLTNIPEKWSSTQIDNETVDYIHEDGWAVTVYFNAENDNYNVKGSGPANIGDSVSTFSSHKSIDEANISAIETMNKFGRTEPEEKPDIEVLRLLDELDSIIVGNYQGQPDEIDRILDEVIEELEKRDLLDEHDSILNQAADVLTEELRKMSEGV